METDLKDQLQLALGAAYTLDRELGGGGMSRVFLADEGALRRRVVLKVLHPELAAAVKVERFEREIHLAARLQHPNIVPVLAAGDAEGLPYYVMPYVEGESLRSRLSTGPLPIAEAVRILRDVAAALSYSHERGVVHRDIKPDNILLTRHHALVTDFGVAKAVSASSERDAEALTTLGLTLGTPAYMAPEQAAADPAIDHRADIYALGAVAYEALTGVPLFGRRSPTALLAAQLSERPRPVGEQRADIPAPLAALVMRCLEKSPADRPQSAEEVLQLLESTPSGEARTLAAAARPSHMAIAKVAIGYVASLLLVVGLAELATDRLGLPDWVLPGAILVMALILPVLAFSALSHRATDARSEQSFAAESTGKISGSRLGTGATPRLTWRRSLKLTAYAVAVFAAIVGAYEVLRALGIGSVGSLVAKGVLEESDPILVADFRVAGGDSVLGPVVTEALRTDLGQSRVVTVMQPAAVRDALVRMRRPPETAVDARLARDVATREGVRAFVEGTVDGLGSGYLLTARLVATESGNVLARFRETAESEAELISAIDRLSRKLRERIGESLKTIRATRPLDRVTTSSLEALQRYTQGVRAMEEADNAKAIALLEEAVRLDTAFAMAYRKLGVAYQRQGDRAAKQNAMFEKAYQFRDRLPEVERYLAIGSYHGHGPRYDLRKSLAAYEALLEIDPANTAALNNAALHYLELRDFPRSIEYLRRATDVDTTNASFLGNLFDAQVSAGRFEEAQVTQTTVRARFPASYVTLRNAVLLAVIGGDYEAAERHTTAMRDARPGNLDVRTGTLWTLAALATTRGRLADGDRLIRDAVATERQRGVQAGEVVGAVRLAVIDVWFRGDSARARARLDAVSGPERLAEIPPVERPYLDLANVYAFAGRPERASALLAEFDRTGAPAGQKSVGDRETTIGFIAFAERRYADALAAFRAADVGKCTACTLPAFGLIHDRLGNADSAIAAFERYVAQPSVERVLELDPFFLAPTHERLGQLYEARGDAERATRHYARFLELWSGADPELGRRVQEARRRLAELKLGEKRRAAGG